MSLAKGKEKAITIDYEDNEDEIFAYFTAKKRTYTKPRSKLVPSVQVMDLTMFPGPIKHASPPAPILSDVSEGDSDEDDDEQGASKKKRKKKKKPVQKMRLPEWTRQSSTESGRKKSVGRGSTEERRDGAPM